jgi:putative acetyltransferase
MTIEIRDGDLTDPQVRSLIGSHLADMHAGSPPESVHALGVAALADPSIRVWTAWRGDRIAGIGALKELAATRGEIKSMRVADDARGTGVGRALLRRIMAAAAERGMTGLWLETGSADSFLPARRLYASEGFTECGPFEGYTDDPLSVYMTRTL